MRLIERLFSRIAAVMLYLGAASLFLMTMLVVIASFMRYLVNRPFDFTEELVALLYMAMVFLAIPLVTVRRVHVNVSVMPERWMTATAGWCRIGAGIVMIAFCAWFAIEAYGFMEQSRRFNSKSEQVEILLWPWMAVMPATMIFVGLITLVNLLLGRAAAGDSAGEGPPRGDAL